MWSFVVYLFMEVALFDFWWRAFRTKRDSRVCANTWWIWSLFFSSGILIFLKLFLVWIECLPSCIYYDCKAFLYFCSLPWDLTFHSLNLIFLYLEKIWLFYSSFYYKYWSSFLAFILIQKIRILLSVSTLISLKLCFFFSLLVPFCSWPALENEQLSVQ